MTNPKKPKKFLPLDNARIYPNRDTNSFNIVASTDEIPGGFILKVQPGAMEEKIRAYFQKSGVSEPQQTDDVKLPEHVSLSYGTDSNPATNPAKSKPQHILSDSTRIYDEVMGSVVAVTSVRGGAGKTSTAVMLASTLASAKNQAGRPLKTVVVDCDVTDPGLADLFAPKYLADVMSFKDLDYVPTLMADVPAVPDFLINRTSIEDMSDADFLKNIVFSKSLGIHVVFNRRTPIGHPAQSPEVYRAIIERLKKYFDVVILDTSGYQQSSICAEVAFPLADKIVLVQHESKIIPYIQHWVSNTKNFPSLGLPEIDLSKLTVVAVSPFGVETPGKAFEPILGADGKNLIHGALMFGMAGFGPLEFLGKIPLDTIAVQHAANSGQFDDLLKHHPYFGEAFKEIAAELFVYEAVITFDIEDEDSIVPVITADDDCALIGVRPDGKPLAIDFINGPAENGVSQNIFITHQDEQDSKTLVDNLISFVHTKRPDKDVITYGITHAYDFVQNVTSNLEFLGILRSLVQDVKEGKEVNDKVVFLGDMDSSSQKQFDIVHDRVDSAVLKEIHHLIASELNGKMQFVFLSSKGNLYLHTLSNASIEPVRIHFGSSQRNRTTDEFLDWAFGKDVTALSAHWPRGRAYVKAPNYEGLIQAFEVKK